MKIPRKKSPTALKNGLKGVTQNNKSPQNPTLYVGIGASAGGLKAFKQFLEALPPQSGMAFILVQHLASDRESLLTTLLAKNCPIPVQEVHENMPVKPNHVYVIPPNKKMGILKGVLHLLPRKEGLEGHFPIDYFFTILAQDQGNKAAGIVLSGTATDGTLGLMKIKEYGGITFAQDPSTANYNAMPNSAIISGAVDFTLPPSEMPKELLKIGKHPYLSQMDNEGQGSNWNPNNEDLKKIFLLLRANSGVDFTFYKETTIKRRLKRRMLLQKMENPSQYFNFLWENRNEQTALYHDFLITVTNFFRDPDIFETLKKKVFPALLKNRSPDLPIRIWVPGCSSGEEVYSIGMSLIEFLEREKIHIPIQIFGSDIHEGSIKKARMGIYSETMAADVSPARLKRFFRKVPEGYQITKTLRDMCVFAVQNVFKDPPFSKLDLVSCRNLLIYLGPILQKKVMSIFCYALKPKGYLLLGSSETIGSFVNWFSLADKKAKIYMKKPEINPHIDFEFTLGQERDKEDPPYMKEDTENKSKPKNSLRQEAERLLFNQYGLVGVVVNDKLNILQFKGNTGRYLEPPQGEATLSILKMAREGLETGLRSALTEAKRTNRPVKKEGFRMKSNGSYRMVNLNVMPLRDSSGQSGYLVVFEEPHLKIKPFHPDPFEEKQSGAALKKKSLNFLNKKELGKKIYELGQDLEATKDYLQSIIQSQEITNQELQSANEEVVSSNEELQSTNEELQTAKEELESSNEELNTVNDELHNRNLQLSRANDDLDNLVSNIHIPVIIVENNLRIRRFTPMSEKIFNLIPTDVGRKITDITPNIILPNLKAMIAEVTNSVTMKEWEVQDEKGYWYSIRMRPYKTRENKIDGAVISLLDINELKINQLELKKLSDYNDALLHLVQDPLLVLNREFKVKKANRPFYRTFSYIPEETENRVIFVLGNGEWQIPALREFLDQSISQNFSPGPLEIQQNFSDIGNKVFSINAVKVSGEKGRTELILLSFEDKTQKTLG